MKVVVYSRWSFNEGGRLGRFDCILPPGNSGKNVRCTSFS